MKRLFAPRNRHRGADGPKGWPTLLPAVRRVARVVLPLAALAVAGPAAIQAARRHAYFAVETIELQHRGGLAPETLRAALGIAPGDVIWDVDLEAAARRLRAVPWVRTASVRRVLPDRIVARVREHRPAAIVALHDAPGLYYVAANGRIFAQVGDTDGRDLPYLTGLLRADLDGRQGFGPRAVHRALGLLRLARRDALGLGPVSEVHVERDGALTLVPVRPAIPIALGNGAFGRKLARVARVLPLWAGREAEIASVSCEADDEVIVRTRTGRVAKPTRGAVGA